MAFSNNATSSIPIFVQNQILRADDLNSMVNYFEDQSRLNRIFTIGIGIVHGLELSFSDEGLAISPGMGISSDGVLFELTEECVFTHYKEMSVSEKAFFCGEDKKQGPCFDEESVPTNVLEIFTEEQAFEQEEPTDFTDENKEILSSYKDFVLVFLHCEEEENRKSCFNDCEKKGIDLRTGTRVLLVPGTTIGCGENVQTGGEASLEVPFSINRLSHSSGFSKIEGKEYYGLDLCQINTWELLYKHYFNQLVYSDIETVFKFAYEGFYNKIFLGNEENHFHDLTTFFDFLVSNYDPEKLSQVTGNSDTHFIPSVSDIQYCYAFFRDLVLAYEEFYKLACGMNLEADINLGTLSENRCKFPGYIALGTLGMVEGFLEEENPDLKECRTGFFPASKRKNRLQERALILYLRLKEMVDAKNILLKPLIYKNKKQVISQWYPQQVKDVRITASCTQKFGLSHQAIPYYFRCDGLQKHWNADNPFCEKFPAPTHYDTSSIQKNENILLRKLDTFDFYRIEGHLGCTLEEARANIAQSRKKLNLPFDIRPLLIGPGVELDEIFQDENLLDWGELQEVYKNTRADILRRIDELKPNASGPDALTIFYNTLNLTLEVINLKGPVGDDFLEKLLEAIGDLADSDEELRKALENSQGLFKNIFDDLNARVEDIKRALQFHTFAEDHPGMEHLGGVHSGGTFIIVYTYQFSDEESKAHAYQFLQVDVLKATIDILTNNIKAVQKKKIEILTNAIEVIKNRDKKVDLFSDEQILLIAYIVIEARGKDLTDFFGDGTGKLEVVQKGGVKIPGLSKETGKIIQPKLKKSIKEVVIERKEEKDKGKKGKIIMRKVVVADFCLPYYCCSKSLAIRHEITEATPFIFIDHEFCYDPKQNTPELIPFNITPEGGNLGYYTGAGQLGTTITDADADQQFMIREFIQNGELSFTAGKVGVSVRYSLLRQQTSAPVTIYRKPDTSLFTYKRGKKLLDANCNWIGFTYTFTHKLNQGDNFAETARWSFGDGTTETIDFDGTVYEHDLFIDEKKQSTKAKVTLEATNGICENDTGKIIDLCPDKISVKVKKCELEFNPHSNNFLMDINCPDEIQPVKDDKTGLDKYSIIQSEGPGYLEIAPDCIRGDLIITGSIPGAAGEINFNADDLVIRRCLKDENGPYQASFIFVYNTQIISSLVVETLNANLKQPLPPLNEALRLRIKFGVPPCKTTHEFILEILPPVKINAPDKACFEKGMEPIPYTVSPQGGTITYGIKGSADITKIEKADINQLLNLETFINPNNDFDKGKLDVEIKYTYEGTAADNALIKVYKKPEVNKLSLIRRESLIENCEWTGFTFQMAHKLDADEVSAARWDLDGHKEDVNLNASTVKHDFRYNPNDFNSAVKIGLSARNNECSSVFEYKDFDFCPDTMKITLHEDCNIKDRDNDKKVDEIFCRQPKPHEKDKPGVFTFKKGEGQGFFEIRPLYPGGQFDITIESGFMFPDTKEFLETLIKTYCLPTEKDRSKLVSLFFYDWDQIEEDSNIKNLLEIQNGPKFGLESDVVLNIKYFLSSPCDLSEEFKVIIKMGGFNLENLEKEEKDKEKPKVVTKTEKPGTAKTKEKKTTAKPKKAVPKKAVTKKVTTVKVSKAKPTTKAKPAKPSKKAMEMLNGRSAAQREILNGMESDKALARTKPFGLAKSFLILPANDLSVVNLRFEEVLKSLIASLGRATGKRKTDLNKVTATLLQNYLDKQTLLSPAAIDPATQELLENQLPKLKQKKIRLGTVRKSWNSEELKKAFKAKAVDQFNDLLK